MCEALYRWSELCSALNKSDNANDTKNSTQTENKINRLKNEIGVFLGLW